MRVFLIFALLLGKAFALELSLPDAIGFMEAGNQSLKAGQSKLESAQSASKAMQGNFLPVVKLELIAEHLDRDLVLDLDPVREVILQMQSADALNQRLLENQLRGGAAFTPEQQSMIRQNAYAGYDQVVPHFRDTIKNQNHWLGNVTIYQPLFHGGKILAANRIAEAKRKVAEQENIRKKLDLHREFSKLYIQASILKASIQLRANALDAMESHKERAKSLVEQGMVDRTALLRAQIALADGQTALQDDKMKLHSIGIVLAQISGMKEPIFPLDSLTGLPPDFENKNRDESRKSPDHPIVSILQAQEDLAGKAIDVKNADFVPEIGAFGKYEINQSALSSLEPNWVVGVKGTVTLFRGGNDYFQRKSAIATKREVQWLKADIKSALDAQYQRQLLVLQQSRLRYRNQEVQEELAKENHRFTLRRFEEGQGTGLEVIDAWLALQKVQLERIASAGETWYAVLEIQWSMGNTTDFVHMWQGVNSK